MAAKTLGPSGKIVTFVSYLLLLYALVAAYISGGGSLLTQILRFIGIDFPSSLSCLAFVAVLGTFVFHGIKAVDLLNRTLFSVKASFLVISLILLTPYIDWSSSLVNSWEPRYIWAGAPIFLYSFGYHVLIPSLTNYLDRDPKIIRRVLFWGAFLTMVIYAVWILELWSVISADRFKAFVASHGSTGEFIALVMSLINNKWVGYAINSFANVTITTSFLGVSLSLFDFLKDALKTTKIRPKRYRVALLTFGPPALFAMFYPQGFITALGYAALCVAFSLVLLPVLMAWKARKKYPMAPYRVFGGSPLLAIVFLAGLAIIGLQLLISYLPIYGS